MISREQYIIYTNYHISPKFMHASALLWMLPILAMCCYDVPSYYGHFSRNFFLPSSLNSGRFRYFQFHQNIDMDTNNSTIYWAHPTENCIKKYDINTSRITTVAGRCGQSGDRVGGLSVMLLNGPRGLVSYQPHEAAASSEQEMTIRVVRNKDCDLSEPSCLLTDSEIMQGGLDAQTNLRADPALLQFPSLNDSLPMYLYVSDTENHCLKRLDLFLHTSTVVAGTCGESGFKDGPSIFNRLNRPTRLGITRSGVLYFYDEGNEYMRILDTNGEVKTLLNGACRGYGVSRNFTNYEFRNVLCYENWIEGQTAAPTQHVLEQDQIEFCTDHSSKCK